MIKHIIIAFTSLALLSGNLILEAHSGKAVQLKTEQIVEAMEQIKDRGPHQIAERGAAGEFIDKLVSPFRLGAKKEESALSYLKYPLENITYYFAVSQEEKALESLEIAKTRFSESSPQDNTDLSDGIFEILIATKNELDNLLVTGSVINADIAVVNMIFQFLEPGDQKIDYYEGILSNKINRIPKIYKLLGKGAPSIILSDIDNYIINIKKLISVNKSPNLIKKDLETLYGFIIANSLPFKLEFFEKIYSLENIYLNALSDKDKKEAEKLFSSEKIKFLHIVRNILETEKISLGEAEKLNTFFIQKSGYMPEELKKIAPDLAEFLEFLKAPEYVGLSGSITEKFKQYKKDKEEASKILEFVEDFEDSSEVNNQKASDVISIVKVDFEKLRVKDLEVKLLNNEYADPEVFVKGRIANMKFSGTYNVNRKILVDLIIKEAEFKQAIPLDKLKLLLASQYGIKGDIEQVIETNESSKEQSVDNVIITIVKSELGKAGLTLEPKNIKVIDSGDNIFLIDTETYSFEFYKQDSLAKNLIVKTKIGEIKITKDMPLKSVANKIQELIELAEKG